MACAYSNLVTRLVFVELGWADILDCAVQTVRFTSQILVIVAAAGLFSWLLTVNQVRQTIVAQSVLGMETTDIYRGVFPVFAVFLLVLVVVTFAPSVALTSMDVFMSD